MKKNIIPTLSTFFLMLSLLLPGLVTAQNALRVRYLPPEFDGDQRSEYYYDLLELALMKTVDQYGAYELVPATGSYTQREGLIAMRKGAVDVVHTMTSGPREMVFRPVRVPLLKGLIGYRLLMVQEGKENILAGNPTEAGARSLTYLQGADWPDTEILKKNDFEVITREEYRDLIPALKNGEASAFPRSVLEIFNEIEKTEGVAIERRIALQYPTAMYFFTNKTNKELADRIETGLNMAIRDGSFNEIFARYYSEDLEKAKLDGRTIIELNNPLLPEDTPLSDQQYWISKKGLR